MLIADPIIRMSVARQVHAERIERAAHHRLARSAVRDPNAGPRRRWRWTPWNVDAWRRTTTLGSNPHPSHLAA